MRGNSHARCEWGEKLEITSKTYLSIYGVISTYILYSTLKELGAQVDYYIPQREEEGYGLNSDRIRLLREEGYEVILTCDNGISAIEQARVALGLGFTLVITDHHDIPYKDTEEGRVFMIPEAHAVINPKQLDCHYPFKQLCGAGVAMKFAEGLYKSMGRNIEEARKYIEYAAIGTVCDVVDLIGENRIIVKNGLRMLNSTKNIGLKALMNETGINNKRISTYHLGFVIGPEINATGRLESATLALELLLEKNEALAKEKAKRLHELNVERQRMTQESVELLEEQIAAQGMDKDKIFVLYCLDIHESIAGIAAGRIKEKYNRPTIVLTRGKEMPKGSGRSIEGYNMFEELSKGRELMEKFGGHPMAAGLSLREENIIPLRNFLNENCALTEEELIPRIRFDLPLGLEFISEKLLKEIEVFEPFGKANPSPLFGAKNIKAIRINFIGKERNILKLRLEVPKRGLYIDGISFDKGEAFKEIIKDNYTEEEADRLIQGGNCNLLVDFIFYPSINEYNGYRNIQLIIKSIRLTQR
ncbi:MAG: single-stranded-DNA-specific exonuclease RecJ [Clostridiaceae bacterium]